MSIYQPVSQRKRAQGVKRAIFPETDRAVTTTVSCHSELSLYESTAYSRHTSLYVRFTKPALDRLGAACLLVLFAPALLLISLLIRLRLGRGILFRQDRCGRNGEHFTMYKFRTMAPDRRKQNLGPPAGEERRQCHKVDEDPRHTALGRHMRRLSLDELPQLWNVVRGEMSLVGPRPELAHVVRAHHLTDHPRHLVRPGVTGAWQVSPLRGALLHESLHLDLQYIESVSFTTDARIVLRTARAVFGRPLGR
jgi:lipopolysaccharide/colanic/teichoic acid biosynthesis glycosyltransferase